MRFVARNTNPNINAATVADETAADTVVIDTELQRRILDYTYDTSEEFLEADEVVVEPLIDAPLSSFEDHTQATAAITELAEKTNKLKMMLAETQSWADTAVASPVSAVCLMHLTVGVASSLIFFLFCCSRLTRLKAAAQ